MKSLNYLFFIIFFILEPCLAFSQSNDLITDLESLDSPGFTNEANNWVYKELLCPACLFSMPSGLSCEALTADEVIYGGPTATNSGSGLASLKRTYPTTIEWKYLSYEFDIWVFTTSELANAASIIYNSNVFYIQFATHSPAPKLFYKSKCSTDFTSSKGAQIKYIYKYHVQDIMTIIFPASPLTLTIRSLTGSANNIDSVGFRNLKIWNLKTAPSNTTITASFPCASRYFWNGATCQTCDSTCQSCSGPNSDQCTTCNSTFYDDGNGVCRTSCTFPFQLIPGTMKCVNQCSPGFYWARNQSCIATCEAPLVQSLDGNGGPLCSSPCSNAIQYVYPDKSCSLTCDALLKDISETTIKLCLNPCQTSSMFVYPDGNCVNTCPTPLTQKTENNIKYCESTCPSTVKFIYKDQSCSPTCDSPLIANTENGILSCNSPCEGSTKYLYPDGSCLDTCPNPFSQKTENNIKFCYSTCSGATKYVNPDKSCSATCDPLLIENTENGIFSCSSPCSDSTKYLYPNGACLNTCPAPLSEKTEKNIKYCSSHCSGPTKYINPDGSCTSACDSLLKENTENDIFACSSPCQTSSEFVYPDGNCVSTCPVPLSEKTEKNVKYCYSTCTSTAKYLFKDQSCSSTCDLPLIEKTENDVFLCISPCQTSSEFLYPDGACVNTCSPPFSQKTENGNNFCESACSDTTQFVYSDKSCSASCDPPLTSHTENGILSCNSPCGSAKYLYPSGACVNTCPTPLSQKTEKNIKYCSSHCSGPTKYINPDGSCTSVCDPHLKSLLEHGISSCINRCDSTEYLFPDNSCGACPAPFSKKIENNIQYCENPCFQNKTFLYENGTCQKSCNPPYVKSQSYNADQCLSPCEDPSKEYFYEAEQVCKSTCTSPYEPKTVDGVKICSQTSQLTPQEVKETESLVSSMKSQGKVTETGMKTASVLSSGSPSFAWLAGQASMLFYIRYMNLNYTPKLKLVLSLQDENPFGFTVGIDVPERLKGELRDRELPEIFERFEIHSNFFYNSWDMLSSFFLILGIILALSVVKMFTAKYTKVDRVLAGVLGSLKWNTLLMVICSSFGEVFFNASMQFQAGSVDTAWEVFSIILAIAMIFIGIAILVLNGKVAKDLWRSRNDKSAREGMEKKWENFELFFETCERNSLVSIGCMGIFLGRTLVFNLIIANLYNYPLIQSILINLITFGMAGYLISKRPLKNLLEFGQILLSEIFVVIVNICVLIIAIMDHAEIQGQDLRRDVCNTIITIFSLFTSFNLAFLAIQVLIALVLFARILRRLKAQGQLHLRGVSSALFFGNKENMSVEENNNAVQIQPQIREISHTTEDFNMTNKIDETENHQDSSRTFIPHRPFRRNRIINPSRSIHPSFSFLDRSVVEIFPSEGSFHRTFGLNINQKDLGMNQVTLESNNQDSVLQAVDSEKRSLGLPGTISQYRKMKNYLRRNRDKRQQE